MTYVGDIRLGDTVDVKFCTVTTTGAPTTLAGSPVISAYLGNNTTQLTAGITLSVDFDGVTGLNNVRVVATSGNGYATATNYQLVITTGTVGGTSVVGYVVAQFSIEARSAVMPTTAARTLDVSATGEAGVDWANVGSPTTSLALTGTTIATTQKVDIETIKTNPVVNAGTVTFPTTATLASTTNITAGTLTTVTTATTATNLTNAPTNGDFTATMKTSIGTAVAASAVASVTGNVGGNVTGSVGSVVGAVGSVTGNVGGNVVGSAASVTGNVGGNVVGSVASVTGNVGGNLVGTLSATERNAIADANLDRADAIETGLTPRQALRLHAAALAGKLSGAATTTVTIRNAVADSKARITATVDADGNRSAVTTDVT